MLVVVPVKDTTMLTVVMVEKPILTVHREGNGCDG